jgi:hypothetical protein
MILRRLVGGALAGLVATVPMSVGMIAARHAGVLGEHPPKRLVRTVLPGGGPRKKRQGEDTLTTAAHLGFGLTGGVIYGLLVPRRVAGATSGILYGLTVWGVSYQGWIPAIGAMPPADRDRPGRPETMAAVHAVYGLVLGRLVRRALRRGGRRYPYAASPARRLTTP